MESAHSLSDAKIATPIVQLASNAGDPFGPIATATPVQPPNVDNVANVAMLPIQKPGAWHLVATAEQGGYPRRGPTGADPQARTTGADEIDVIVSLTAAGG